MRRERLDSTIHELQSKGAHDITVTNVDTIENLSHFEIDHWKTTGKSRKSGKGSEYQLESTLIFEFCFGHGGMGSAEEEMFGKK